MADPATLGHGRAQAASRRRARTGLISGAVLAAAALAAAASLAVGPASTPSAAGPGPSVVAVAPAGVPTAGPGPAQAFRGSPPLHISYPAIGMDQEIKALTPADPESQTLTPPLTTDAYWLTPYGSPGSTDTTYVVGHSWDGRDTAFNHLSSDAKPGDRMTVVTAAGPVAYSVTSVSTEDKDTLKDSPIWKRVPNRLVLVSCYTADLQGTNIVVTADVVPAA